MYRRVFGGIRSPSQFLPVPSLPLYFALLLGFLLQLLDLLRQAGGVSLLEGFAATHIVLKGDLR